jgi:predicted dehydrogenase
MALRLGFIGTGGIANRHLEEAQRNPDIEMVGYCDTALERAQAAADRFGGAVYQDFRDLYDQEKPDAVVICTPPFAHGEIEEAACERGIHLFVEKPVAVNLATANRVATAVRESGVISQVGYMYRCSPPLIALREVLQTRRPAMIQAHYYMPGLPGPVWYPKRDLGGGQLIEQATHMLDLARFLGGEVATVAGAVTTIHDWTHVPAGYEPEGLLRYSSVFEIPDTTALVMQFENGALGTLSCSMVPQATWDVGFKVVADGILATVNDASASWVGEDSASLAAPADWVNYVLRDFVAAVIAGRPASVPYEEGVRSLAISLAGYESVARGGAPVRLADLVA